MIILEALVTYPLFFMVISIITLMLTIYETDGIILPFLFHGRWLYHYLDTALGWREGNVNRYTLLDFSISRSWRTTLEDNEYLTLGRMSATSLLISILSASMVIAGLILRVMMNHTT